jgi:hypothetical protein
VDPDARALIAADIALRLRRVCGNWPDDLFNEMVQRLADITVRYDGVTTPSTYDRRTTDRLVAELREALERSQSEHADKKREPGEDTTAG